MVIQFNIPPNWPSSPDGWTPPPGWAPEAAWGPAPPGWEFWLDSGSDSTGPAISKKSGDSAFQAASPPAPASGTTDNGTRDSRVPMFGARSRARDLADELAALKAHYAALGLLDLVELQQLRTDLSAETSEMRQQMETERDRRGIQLDADLRAGQQELHALQHQIAQLRTSLVVTEEAMILQEVGIYNYRHPSRTQPPTRNNSIDSRTRSRPPRALTAVPSTRPPTGPSTVRSHRARR
jgi:hypothetical protein